MCPGRAVGDEVRRGRELPTQFGRPQRLHLQRRSAEAKEVAERSTGFRVRESAIGHRPQQGSSDGCSSWRRARTRCHALRALTERLAASAGRPLRETVQALERFPQPSCRQAISGHPDPRRPFREFATPRLPWLPRERRLGNGSERPSWCAARFRQPWLRARLHEIMESKPTSIDRHVHSAGCRLRPSASRIG